MRDEQPHRAHHRGKSPEDERLFAPEAVLRMQTAVVEVAWLLGRGYPMKTVIDVVGAHHQLESRQRVAVQRGVCSEPQYRRRAAREVWPEDVARRPLAIDGLNLLITLEVALSGGLLIQCLDGSIRDIAGVHASYHPVEETDPALERIFGALKALKVKSAKIYLDEPVSNSGLLRERFLEHSKKWRGTTEVLLVPKPDEILARSHHVVTSDSAILDECESWFNLTAFIVDKITNAWKIQLQEGR